MARDNLIYDKARCSYDNPLGKVVPGMQKRTSDHKGPDRKSPLVFLVLVAKKSFSIWTQASQT